MKRIIDIDEEEYNRIRHFCSFGDNNIPLGWYEIAKSKPLQTELKEIKEEIDNLQVIPYGTMYGKEDMISRVCALSIIDKYINKADCDNDCEHCEWTECPKD